MFHIYSLQTLLASPSRVVPLSVDRFSSSDPQKTSRFSKKIAHKISDYLRVMADPKIEAVSTFPFFPYLFDSSYK